MKTIKITRSDIEIIPTQTGSHRLAVVIDAEEHQHVIRRGNYRRIGFLCNGCGTNRDGEWTVGVTWGSHINTEIIDDLRLVIEHDEEDDLD